MTLSNINRVFAVFGIIGFFCIISSFIGAVSSGDNPVTFISFISILAWVFLMFGVLAVYLSQMENMRVLGFISTILFIFAMTWTIGSIAVHEFAFPVIYDIDSSMDLSKVTESELPSPIWEAEVTSSILFIAGSGLYGLTIMLFSKTARWPGVLLLIVSAASILKYVSEELALISYLGYPIAVAWMCVKLLKTDTSKQTNVT